MFVCVCLPCSSVLLLHLISPSLSVVSVWVDGRAGWHRAQRDIRGGSSPAPLHPPLSLVLSSSLRALCCSAEPALLPELLPPKPGCSLRPLHLLVFFFSLMSTENFMPLSHTSHLQNHKKGNERTERRITKQDGDSCSDALPPSSSSSRLGIRKNTFSKPPHPPLPLQCQDLGL